MPPSLASLPLHKIDDWLMIALRVSIYLLGAWLLTFLIDKLFQRLARLSNELIAQRGGTEQSELQKQTNNITVLLRRALFTAIWALAIVLALQQQLKFDIRPVLAGAGVAGLAVGFAAQSVLKDWISGFFLLTEGRMRVNDVIKIGELSGSVESLSLRSTVLRAFDGSVHVFSNGTVQNFSNLTLGHAFAVFEVAADYEEQPEALMTLLAGIGAELRQDEQFSGLILDDMEVAGIDRFTEQGVVVKARIKTLPGKQWPVGREVNRLLRLRCASAGITIATAQRAVQLRRKGEPHVANPSQSTVRS